MAVAFESCLANAPPVTGVRRDSFPKYSDRETPRPEIRPSAPGAGDAPVLSGVEAPVPTPTPQKTTAAIAVFLSLILHAGLLVWAILSPPVSQTASPSGEIVVDGISVILIDETAQRNQAAKEKAVADEGGEAVADADKEIVAADSETALVDPLMTTPGDAASAQAAPSRTAIADSEMAMPAAGVAALAEPEMTSLADADRSVAESEMAMLEIPAPSASAMAEPEARRTDANEAARDSDIAMPDAARPQDPGIASSDAAESPVAEVLAKDIPDDTPLSTTLDVDSAATENLELAEASSPPHLSESESDAAEAAIPAAGETAPLPSILTAPSGETSAPRVPSAAEIEGAGAVPPAEKTAASLSRSAERPAQKETPKKVTAAAASTASGRVNATSYRTQLAAHLRRFRSYPEAARAQGLWGTARVSFTVNAKGQVTGARLTGSSGHALLDRTAVSMVRRASPFPPIPKQVGTSVLTVDVPVRFDRR